MEGEAHYNDRILGDATGEMGPLEEGIELYSESSWYEDIERMVNTIYPWFYRGCDYSMGFGTGIFSSSIDTGRSLGSATFRIILTPA